MREEKGKFIWLNGQFVPWDDAKIHVHTQCVLGGLNAYEGLQAYWNEERMALAVFRFDAHLERLALSAKMMRMTLPYSLSQLKEATVELLNRSHFRRNVGIRIVCYIGEGVLFGYLPEEVEVGAFIYAASRTGVPSPDQGVHCCISSWHRISDQTAPPRIKCGANYQNVRMAHVQARVDGYDEVILLNGHGKVAEGPIRNVAIVRNGVLITPDTTSGILEGITRATMIALARNELNLPVEERTVDRTELYAADEVFLTQSNMEVLPVLSVDRIMVGDGRPGPITKKIHKVIHDAATGKNPSYHHWLTPVKPLI